MDDGEELKLQGEKGIESEKLQIYTWIRQLVAMEDVKKK